MTRNHSCHEKDLMNDDISYCGQTDLFRTILKQVTIIIQPRVALGI